MPFPIVSPYVLPILLLLNSNLLVTAQVGWRAHERRMDIAKFEGSRVRASMMFQPCFLAVEEKKRMSAKSIAPSNERKPPEIFWRSFIMRRRVRPDCW